MKPERRVASRRDVFWCFGVSIVMSVLAIFVGVGRSQQLADQRVRDQTHAEQQHSADQDAQQRAQTAQLGYALAASNYAACTDSNTFRQQVLGYIDDQTALRIRSVQATLASPSSTADQKRVALFNLAASQFSQKQLHARIPFAKCGTAPTPP